MVGPPFWDGWPLPWGVADHHFTLWGRIRTIPTTLVWWPTSPLGLRGWSNTPWTIRGSRSNPKPSRSVPITFEPSRMVALSSKGSPKGLGPPSSVPRRLEVVDYSLTLKWVVDQLHGSDWGGPTIPTTTKWWLTFPSKGTEMVVRHFSRRLPHHPLRAPSRARDNTWVFL